MVLYGIYILGSARRMNLIQSALVRGEPGGSRKIFCSKFGPFGAPLWRLEVQKFTWIWSSSSKSEYIFLLYRGIIFSKSTKITFSLRIIGLVRRVSLLLVSIDSPRSVEHFSYELYGAKSFRTQSTAANSAFMAFQKILF